jgi:predicted DNA-binding transcriptional regulator AlpA
MIPQTENQTAPEAETPTDFQTEYLQNTQRRIQAAAVRQLCGGVSDMALWRWLNDSKMNFPKPVYINRRRFWLEIEICAWLDAQTGRAA